MFQERWEGEGGQGCCFSGGGAWLLGCFAEGRRETTLKLPWKLGRKAFDLDDDSDADSAEAVKPAQQARAFLFFTSLLLVICWKGCRRPHGEPPSRGGEDVFSRGRSSLL